jgi:hypothetical protein
MDGWYRRMPERWGNLYRVHHAWFSGQVHAFHESASRIAVVIARGADLRPSDPCLAKIHPGFFKQGTELEKPV